MAKVINKTGRPMYEEQRPSQPIRAPHGTARSCATWDAEAAKRMLMNNLDPTVAVDWENLVVYGGSGRAARNWRCYRQIVAALETLAPDETLCVQSGKPVYVARTWEHAPRVMIANSNLVPQWATQTEFDRLDALGLMMYGQMTAGSWIYIGTQGILQGTYETFASLARQEFGADSLAGKFVLTAGLGGMSGAQPLAATMNEAAVLIVEVRADRIARKVEEGYCDRMSDDLDEALGWIETARSAGEPLSVGVVGNAADVFAELATRGAVPDVVTDQTSAHDLLDYVPQGDLDELDALRRDDPDEYKRRSVDTIMRQASCRRTCGRCSATARGRFAGPACRVTPPTWRCSTTSCCVSFPTTPCCTVGYAWRVSACRSSACRRAYAGSVTATGRASVPP